MGSLQQLLLCGLGVSQYDSLIIAQNPDQYFRLNETSGTVATDSSGHSHNATYQRDASLTTGPGILNGSTQPAFVPSVLTSPVNGLTYPNCVIVTGSSTWTVTMMIQPTLPPTNPVGTLIQVGANGVSVPEIDVIDQGNGTFRIRLLKSGVATLVTSTDAWAYGTKMQVKLSQFSGSNTTAIRVSTVASGNVTEGSINIVWSTQMSHTNIAFGNTGSGATFPFAGTMSNVALWNSYLSDTITDAFWAAA